MNTIKATTIGGVRFWSVYGVVHYAQSHFTPVQAMQDYTRRFRAGTLYPPQFFDGWIPFGGKRTDICMRCNHDRL